MKPLSDDWDAHWRDNAAAAAKNPAQAYRHALVLGQLQKIGAARPAVRLIDFGSGQGDFLLQAARTFPKMSLVGFELSEEGVRITAEKVPTARVLRVDLFHPSAEAEAFRSWAGAAVCSEVLEHLDDPGRFVRAMGDYLAPGAFLIITVPGGPISAFDKRIGHRQHFTVRRLQELIGQNGLICRGVQRAGFPFHNLYRLTVIARGDRLARDAREIDEEGGRAARLAMRVFAHLFRANLPKTPWGWQLLALAKKGSD